LLKAFQRLLLGIKLIIFELLLLLLLLEVAQCSQLIDNVRQGFGLLLLSCPRITSTL
jgi:hypothetical protein